MTTTTIATTACCTDHDGPHVHGCTIPRDADGREHRGECSRVAETSIITIEPTMRSALTYPFCPAWCDGHDLDDPYTVEEDAVQANRREAGAPADIEEGDTIWTHSGDDIFRSGSGRTSMWLRRIDRARGGNVVTGGGSLVQGTVCILIQGADIEGPAIVPLTVAGDLAAHILATVEALRDGGEQR